MVTTGRSASELQRAAMYVGFEWISLAEMSSELAQIAGARTAVREHALMDACFLHLRCLIDFSCGNLGGRRHPSDIQPEDFLGFEWSPPAHLDRQLRGRLPVINKHLAHLSWGRVTDTTAILWPMSYLAHEASSAMQMFVQEVRRKNGQCLAQFAPAESQALARLPPMRGGPHTPGPLADPR